MELLKNENYEKCKKIVKLWECNFKKSNGRLPSKLDIREADKNVREAYSIYFKLKTAALEESLFDVLNFNSDETKDEATIPVSNDTPKLQSNLKNNDNVSEIWGNHLNNTQNQKITPNEEMKKDNMNASFSKKLFNNSKFMKRNPRKLFNTSIKKNTSIDISQSDVTLNDANDVNEDVQVDINSSLPVTTNSMHGPSKSVNVINDIINNSTNLLNRNIDHGWLERVSFNSDVKVLMDTVNQGNETASQIEFDDIISDSDVEEYQTCKRIKLLHSENASVKQDTVKKRVSSNDNTETKSIINAINSEIVNNSVLLSSVSTPNVDIREGNVDELNNKNEDAEPTNKRKRKVVNASKTRKTVKKNSSNSETPKQKETNNAEDMYEMEYSLKAPPETVPRYQHLATDIQSNSNSKLASDIKTKPLSKREQAKEKLMKRIESGTLNDNYVKIDIKKKVFVRGKKHMNFTKYKKQQWKNKKKSLYGSEFGCDGGSLTCFTCGKTGHFAGQCKETLVDKLLPLEAVEETCPFPSLEEACKMAKGNVLAVHVSNMKSSNETEINSVSDRASHAGESGNEADVDFEDDEEIETFMLDNDFKENTYEDVPESDYIKPFYSVNSDGSLIETPTEVFEALKKFGHTSFNIGQEQAIMRILSGLSTLVTLSTGSGKSLCYQLPAYLYAKRTKCITLVISPLVSLMEDQVAGIPAFLKAACFHTLQTKTQRDKVLQALEAGDLNVLLVSPETIIASEKKSGFGSLLKKLPPIAFVCIDEAHCVSQWSHNFRPSYLMICRVLRERLGIKIVLGLTATSTRVTSNSIVEHLQIADGQNGVISDIPLPENLHLNVSCDIQRDIALKNILTTDPYGAYDSIIIYCTRREECERLASYLRTTIRTQKESSTVKKYKSVSEVAEPYHAGLSASKRKTVQNAFMAGYLRIVVATIAFGMGINKSNIRGIIHYNMPKNFENYVQEVGRAGRDGLPAHCHLFLDSEGKDQNELRRHIHANSTERHVIRKLLQKIFVRCDCKNRCPRHEVAFSVEDTVRQLDVPEENISTLICYLELHENRYLEALTPVYTICKVISYGGPQHMYKAAQDCPPLAMALALHRKSDDKENAFEFPVVDVAAAMGWDSGFVKQKLKNLEWIRENNAPKRSTLTVEFSNLGFHVRAPGNLSPNELDEALDSLYAKKQEQELMSLQQLQIVHTTLTSVCERYYHLCFTENYQSKAQELKFKIRQYFSSEEPLKNVEIVYKNACDELQIAADVRSLIAMYKDNNFTGRAVARIFHGIQSPNYPAVIWGKCKFWRLHLGTNFAKLQQIASAEILKYR